MSLATQGADFASAPRDFTSLYELYYDHIVNTVRRAGITANLAEDVAQGILLRLYERDFLATFDPTLTFEYKGEQRPARFKSYLTRTVLAYVKGHRDRQQRIYHRELLIADEVLNEDDRQDSTWMEVFGGSIEFEDEVIDMVDADGWTADIRAYLEQVPRRSKIDQCDLPRLWDACVAQIMATGRKNEEELARQFGVSIGAMYTWMFRLKTHLAVALGLPVPKRRPRNLTK